MAVDLGGAVGRYGRQAELQYQLAANAWAKMGYAAVGFGPKDLRLPEGLAAVVNDDEDHRLVAANVNVLDLTKPFRVVEAGGMKVGITSILGEEYCKDLKNEWITLKNPRTALAEIVPQMQKECDYLILLSNAKPAESMALAKEFPQFNVVVTGGGAEIPDHELKPRMN